MGDAYRPIDYIYIGVARMIFSRVKNQLIGCLLGGGGTGWDLYGAGLIKDGQGNLIMSSRFYRTLVPEQTAAPSACGCLCRQPLKCIFRYSLLSVRSVNHKCNIHCNRML